MRRNVFLLLSAVAMLVSCYPDGAETYQDMDIVYTNYDEKFDFVSKGTYSLPDKIVKITGNLAAGELPEYVNEPYNTQILNRIESNMTALGWTKVDAANDSDLALLPASWTNTTVYYWSDYWCWYYYYYCGWGWYYPTVSTVTTGTLVLSLVAAGEEYIDPSIVWVGAANGVLSGSYNTSRVNDAIDQAFEQSPYLNTK